MEDFSENIWISYIVQMTFGRRKLLDPLDQVAHFLSISLQFLPWEGLDGLCC